MDMLCVITFLLLSLIQEIESVLLKRTVINSISNEIVLFASDEPSLLACAQRCRFIDKIAIIDFNGSRCTCLKGKTDEGQGQTGALKEVFVNQAIRIPKPINGNWSQWNLTTNCTTTKECGKRKVFERVCSKPEPGHGEFSCLALSGKRRLKETKTESCVKCKTYKIEVKTSNVKYGGTDANVFIRLYGDKDFSDDVQLSPTTLESFEQNNVDTFRMEIIDVGKITKLVLGHDNTKKGAGWDVDYVTFTVDGCETKFEIKATLDPPDSSKEIRKTFEKPKEICN